MLKIKKGRNLRPFLLDDFYLNNLSGVYPAESEMGFELSARKISCRRYRFPSAFRTFFNDLEPTLMKLSYCPISILPISPIFAPPCLRSRSRILEMLIPSLNPSARQTVVNDWGELCRLLSCHESRFEGRR